MGVLDKYLNGDNFSTAKKNGKKAKPVDVDKWLENERKKRLELEQKRNNAFIKERPPEKERQAAISNEVYEQFEGEAPVLPAFFLSDKKPDIAIIAPVPAPVVLPIETTKKEDDASCVALINQFLDLHLVKNKGIDTIIVCHPSAALEEVIEEIEKQMPYMEEDYIETPATKKLNRNFVATKISDELNDGLQAIATKENRTISALLRKILTIYVKNYNKPE